MSWSSRRAFFVVSAVALLAGLASYDQAQAQRQPRPRPQQPPPSTGSSDASELGGLNLPVEEKYADRFAYIKDRLSDKVRNYPEAIEVLQKLLELTEDVFTPIETTDKEGRKVTTLVNVRAHAEQIVANLPEPGMKYYQLQHGPEALKMLKEAKDSGDSRILGQIMQKYLYTDAGAQATMLLANYQLDRGNYGMAASCYQRLFQRVGIKKVDEKTLFKAALAFHRANDFTAADQCWKELALRTSTVKLGNQSRSVDELKQWVAQRKGGSTTQVVSADTHLFGGSASRSAQGLGGTAYLEARWKESTVKEQNTRGYLQIVQQYLAENKLPALSAFHPITATLNSGGERIPLVIYRSWWGIHARDVRDKGELFWEAHSVWSPDQMVRNPKHVGALNSWGSSFITNRYRPQVMIENGLVGTLSTDNVRVFMIEDFYIPPYVPYYNQGNPNLGNFDSSITAAARHNKLQAYDLDSGKFLWEAGGPETKDKDKEFSDLGECFFLGAPLPMAGKLWVLVEKRQNLALVTLDPSNGKMIGKARRLGSLNDPLLRDVPRHIGGAHLAHGQGILVCPTNTGALLGINLLTDSLVWAYGYREKNYASTIQPGTMRVSTNWQPTPPIVQDGKVIFTAPDAAAVHCISLRDGTRIWKHLRQEDDLYLGGVYAGRVVIVGKKFCRGLDAETGQEVWRHETGLPSGRGVASKDLYYLPLAVAHATKEPEICVIDVAKGEVVAHTRSRKKEVPGNLLFYEGDVISLGLSEIAVYPQLEVKLKQIDALIAKNPKDPIGLTDRGELRLDKGDLRGAINDLRDALANVNPKEMTHAAIVPKARLKLYESLTEYFQKDFDRAEVFLKEYEAMCKVTVDENASQAEKDAARAEERRRLGNFYCLVGKGREKQRKLVDAFEAYSKFGSLGGDNELLNVIDEPAVKAAPSVWARGRIAAMVAGATREERKPLEALIATRWAEIKQKDDLESLRDFVSNYGFMTQIGQEARLQLAEKLLKENDAKSLLDAERHLAHLRYQSDNPSMAARAVEALARLMTRRGLLEDAAYFYRILGAEYAEVPVKDGKKGIDFYNSLAADKRFLILLDDPAPLVGKIPPPREETGSFGYTPMYRLRQDGENLPFFRRYSLRMRFDYGQLKIIDTRSNEAEYWSLSLSSGLLSTVLQYAQNQQPANVPRFSFQNLGHLVVLQMGHMVYAIDPVNRTKLWEVNLAGQTYPGYRQHFYDARDDSIQLVYSNGWAQRIGAMGQLSPSAICLLSSDALMALDPLSGRVLWTRTDMPKRSHVYSDTEHVFVVEMGDDGTTGAARAFRARDGVTVKLPDFSALYQNKIRMRGRLLLALDQDRTGKVLRLYDVVAGKDVYREVFPLNAKPMQSTDDNLAGMVEPDGKVTFLDLRNPTKPIKAKMEESHIKDVDTFQLLRDDKNFYVGCYGRGNDKVRIQGVLMLNVLPNSGMRCVPVNGQLYAFNASNGELEWHAEGNQQMILLERFKELPVVILTSRYYRQMDQWGNTMMVSPVRIYDKRTGKLLLTTEEANQHYQYHTLKVDPKSGTIELMSGVKKITLRVNPSDPQKAGGGDKSSSIYRDPKGVEVVNWRPAGNDNGKAGEGKQGQGQVEILPYIEQVPVERLREGRIKR